MSNHIYTEKTHYVYQITEISSAKKYIGVRTCKGEPKDDLGVVYFSSSTDKEFMKNQKINRNEYKYEILQTFDSRELANIEEIRLHELYNVSKNQDFINKAKATPNGYNTDGRIVVRDAECNYHNVSIYDPRYLSGELYSMTKGKITVKDNNGNTFQTNNDDPRYLSGEYVSVMKGKITVKDNNGNTFQTNNDDPRYLSGEYVSASVGKVTTKDKDGNIFQICIDDQKLKSGDVVGITKGMVSMIDSNNNRVFTSVDDSRIKSGELTMHTKNKIVVKDKNGNIIQTNINDPRYLSGELIGIQKDKVNVKDIFGNHSQIAMDDPRYNISLFPASAKIMIIDGVLQSSLTASIKYGVSRYIAVSRCKSDKFPNWKFI